MQLSPRLLAIARQVPPERVVADVGTDHALLPVYLVSTGIAPRAIAVELRRGPLDQALRNVQSFGLAGQVELRQGDGLEALAPGEAEVGVIAGLGGDRIVEILEARPEVRASIPCWVLQPMSHAGGLRRWLVSHGYRLADEELVAEGGHVYEVIRAEPGREPPQEALIMEIGPRLWERREPLLAPLLRRRLEEVEARLARPAAAAQAGRGGLERLAARLAEMLAELSPR
ncbi:MAG: SAM-dependent methyltransferase [Clostridia bacterium]|nr:SAM-dependent methyltransferase [Clostridia bacterium]MCL6521196.1 class I SAM-dependent methyltransferase [Bacillota bacterium]